jgi:trehalose synthase
VVAGESPALRMSPRSDVWWKNAVIYCLDVETFRDADGDGTGDVAGLIERIDHVAALGASCLWLMPLYPTPGQDDGYDITDYLGVDPRLGDLGDMVEAIRHANDRGLRVLADLVVNHTSSQHPWFQDARASRSSRYRDYYVWSDDPSRARGTTPENWTWDERAGQHYLHRFAPFQPDLNIANPAVRHEIAKTIGFWLALGVSGFRMDAVPFLCEEVGGDQPDSGDGRRWLHSLREFAGRRDGGAMLMGEVNVALDDIASYFDDHGDALHLQLGFLINQRLWLSLARARAAPLEDLIRHLPVPPRDAGWATFLRNHDELTLDKLAPEEQAEVLAAFGPEPEMQIYGHGIRRRVAPMLGGDGPRLRMAWSLMFTLPGTPVLLYGDEIGMGENLAIDGRMSVRTPMQWAPGPGAGFSRAARDRLVRPLPDGEFGPDRVNVAAQRHGSDTLLAFITRLTHRRRETPELGFGVSTLIENEPPALFAHRCEWQGSSVFTVHNLSGEPVAAELDLGDGVDGVDDLLELREHRVRAGKLRVELGAYGYLWLRARKA